MNGSKELIRESNTKQPTGSSKRKRKHSIKRNIALDDTTCNEVIKSSKAEKTYSKKCKIDKIKVEKEDDVEKESQGASQVSQFGKEEIFFEVENHQLKTETVEENSKGLRTGDSADLQCSTTKQHCQNCKFCADHVIKKEDLNDSTVKKIKSKKKFPCEICAKDGLTRVYNSVEKHKHHLATAHEIYSEEIKRFECTHCPETVWFPTKSKFTYHLGTKHPGIMKFVCEVCTETFILKANYKSHMKTHNLIVQKKFSCDVCNGTFVNKAGYEAHKRRFPGPHIKQSCSHCGFSFSRETHMKNHRCKTLLLEEAARVNNALQPEESTLEPCDAAKMPTDVDSKPVINENHLLSNKKATEINSETESPIRKNTNENDLQGSKRVVFHRIIPRRNQDQAIYRPVQMQTQNVSESVVVQELREIDLESGTFIAAAANESEHQFIVRDLNGHLLPGNQILQLDLNDTHPGEENQVYLADWNIVAPYVIREKSPP